MSTNCTFYIDGYETTYFDAFSTLKQTEKTQVGDSVLNIRKTPYSGSISEVTQVLHRDHLGSVDAVTNSASNITTFAFEPFGARRNSNLLTNISITEMTNLLAKIDVLNSQGYTGHESLDRTGFIHMNGRVYDPQLGRFLSPDPIVQAPTNSQSWNRYSYVFNNPLKYTDPTGFESQPDEITVTGYKPRNTECEGCTYYSKDFLDYTNVFQNNFAVPVVADKTNGLSGTQNNNFNQTNDCENTTNISCALADASSLEESSWGSYLPGVEAGDDASEYWANQLVASGGGVLDNPTAAVGLIFSVLWTKDTAANTAITLAGGGAAKGLSWEMGPAKQWFRLKGSYSASMGEKTALTLSWGAGKAHINKIPTEIGRSLNASLRDLKIPGKSWRTQDAGHFHIKKLQNIE